MQAFRELKRAFDPDNRMNPGNIVDARRCHRPPALRHAATRRGSRRPCSTSPTQGGFAAAIEMCNGVGACRKTLEGTMCPSYMATTRRGALDSRARQRAPRRALGRLPAKGVHRASPLRGDGPLPRVQRLQGRVPVERGHGEAQVRVSPPLLPSQRPAAAQPAVRAHRADESTWALGCPGSSTGSRRSRPAAGCSEKVAGIDRRRPLPALAAQTFTDWFARRTAPAAAPRGEVGAVQRHVHHVQRAGDRRAPPSRLLEAAGYRVVLVDRKCCGRPLDLQGHARRGARPRRLERRALWRPTRARGVADRRARALVSADPA